MFQSVCDFCGKKTLVFRTNFGSSFGYIRLMCEDCKSSFNCEIEDLDKPKKCVENKELTE